MSGTFILAGDVERDQLDWGELGWISRPPNTETKNIVFLDVTLEAGKGHDFHKHPGQEEVIHVAQGEIGQWLEQEKRILKAGDSIFIHEGVVHASFNTGNEPAKLTVVLSPAVGEGGYGVEEVADQAPWNTLRS